MLRAPWPSRNGRGRAMRNGSGSFLSNVTVWSPTITSSPRIVFLYFIFLCISSPYGIPCLADEEYSCVYLLLKECQLSHARNVGKATLFGMSCPRGPEHLNASVLGSKTPALLDSSRYGYPCAPPTYGKASNTAGWSDSTDGDLLAVRCRGWFCLLALPKPLNQHQ